MLLLYLEIILKNIPHNLSVIICISRKISIYVTFSSDVYLMLKVLESFNKKFEKFSIIYVFLCVYVNETLMIAQAKNLNFTILRVYYDTFIFFSAWHKFT